MLLEFLRLLNQIRRLINLLKSLLNFLHQQKLLVIVIKAKKELQLLLHRNSCIIRSQRRNDLKRKREEIFGPHYFHRRLLCLCFHLLIILHISQEISNQCVFHLQAHIQLVQKENLRRSNQLEIEYAFLLSRSFFRLLLFCSLWIFILVFFLVHFNVSFAFIWFTVHLAFDDTEVFHDLN